MSSFVSVSGQGPAGDAGSEPVPGEAPREAKSAALSGYLRAQAADAAVALGCLLRLGPQAGPGGAVDRMGQPAGLLPVSALQSCQALMFMRTTKAGLGLSYSHGTGFLINKISTEYGSSSDDLRSRSGSARHPGPLTPPRSPLASAAASAAAGTGLERLEEGVDGGGGSWGGGWGGGVSPLVASGPQGAPRPRPRPRPRPPVPLLRWSAPAFYSIDSLSVGLTLGLEHTHSVLVLWDPPALAAVRGGRAVLGTDVHVMMGRRADAEDSSGDPAAGNVGGPPLGLGGLGGTGGALGGGTGSPLSGALGGVSPSLAPSLAPLPPGPLLPQQPTAGAEGGGGGAHTHWGAAPEPAGPLEAHGPPSAPSAPPAPARASLSTYTLHEGALIDLSLLGGALHPDQRHNRAVYGDAVTIDDILYGRVQPPEEFGPLYATLRMLTARPGPGREPALGGGEDLGAAGPGAEAAEAGAEGKGPTRPHAAPTLPLGGWGRPMAAL
ncbi:hypothetical protein HYH03_009154 [Edaphochlamys debaryana]|uniref:Ysc84 actin-binding domain-containing protein n=1 Tax=Edaphochlamys debaryana TaxID=47281 RepID=A0A836BYQ2_9CHLO|nr:hypothetical protein HYH03_009154 [Edaphochlamys debaryana]|eukprot:KAG2492489.1 hypothetical protein HYH03_009154 [Edaphochlamys debaryana]